MWQMLSECRPTMCLVFQRATVRPSFRRVPCATSRRASASACPAWKGTSVTGAPTDGSSWSARAARVGFHSPAMTGSNRAP